MYNVWSFFTKRSRFAIILILAILFLGITAIFDIPKESAPEVDVPIAVVSTVLPGASPEDVEKLVTNVLEEPLKNSLSDVRNITSNSSEGVSNITIEFEASADIEKSISDVRDQVDVSKSELPTEALDPRIIEIEFGSDPVVTATLSANIPQELLYQLGEDAADELEKVRGVSSVSVGGVEKREVTVVIDRNALAQLGLTITDVTRAISAANVALPVGNIQLGDAEFPVRLAGDISETQEVADIPILSVGGTPIYVRDIARIVDGRQEPKTYSRTSINSAPSIESVSFDVFKSSSAKITSVSKDVQAKLAELQEEGELLEGMQVHVVFDNGELLQDDLTTLTRSGLQTVLLVTIVLLLAVGWREALIAAISIPLSFLTAFIGLEASGNTLNFVSLFALILSIGIIVDSTIVIVEGINRRLHQLESHEGESNKEREKIKSRAALDVVREFHVPLTAGTMTTVAVFAPLLMVSGITGEFIKSIPFTIIFVLLSSLLVALGFVPMFATKLLRRNKPATKESLHEEVIVERSTFARTLASFGNFILMLVWVNPLFPTTHTRIKQSSHEQLGAQVSRKRDEIVHTIEEWYRAHLSRFLASRESQNTIIVTLFALFVVSLSLPITGAVNVIFFEDTDSDWIFIEAELPTGSILERTDLEIRKAEEILYTIPEATSFVTTVGRTSAFGNTTGGSSSNARFANIFITLDEDRERESTEIIDDIRGELSEIHTSQMRVDQLSDGPPSLAPVTITLSGDSLTDLEEAATVVERVLEEISGTTDITSSTKNNTNEFVFSINRAEAIAQGVSIGTIATTLRAALYGEEATEIKQLGDDIDVITRLALDTQDGADAFATNATTIDTLAQIEVATPTGVVPLSSFVTVSIQPSRSAIRHDDGERIATVSSRLTEEGNAVKISAEFEEKIEEYVLPESVSISVGGESEDVDQSFKDMFVALIIGMVSMFAILVLQFNSFRYAVYVLAIVPLSLIGVFGGLMITGSPLSFPSIMGFIALSGIVVNNSIILVDTINTQRRRFGDTKSVNEIIVDATTSRLRPVLLTALTTVIGVVPLLFAAAIWVPLAYALMFGLAFATIITLLLVPSIYARWPGKFEE
ncbi:efflux RND transporter permease subunit [Candidatus Kaiserbacteria bacterium]|nr:MAG: efflux RND transporter permease subunit [Candidatus Kaiserbacteria bacterium]